MKKKVSVSIDSKVYEKARKLPINISKACEDYLVFLINSIETANGQTTPFLSPGSFAKESGVRSPGFEPGSSAWEGPTKVDWREFEQFLKNKNYRGSGYRTKLSYATRYHGLLFRGELGKLAELTPDAKSQALKALSVLCEFLGCKRLFKREKERFGLKWVGKSADKIFIERLSRSANADDVFEWIRQAKQAKLDLALLLDFDAVTNHCFDLIMAIREQVGGNFNLEPPKIIVPENNDEVKKE